MWNICVPARPICFTTGRRREGAGESIAGILRYEYSIDGSSWQTTNTLQNLSDGTSYTVHVKAIDKAGNETIGQVSAQTEVANQAPTDLSVSYNTKSTDSITINAKANDVNGNQLTYTLYTATSANGSYTAKASQTAAANTQVSLKATGLSQYTTYYYYVTTSDGKETVRSSTSSVRTYCPGTGLTCNGPFSTSSTCTNCDGNGKSLDGSHYIYPVSYSDTGRDTYCDCCGERAITTWYTCQCVYCSYRPERQICQSCWENKTRWSYSWGNECTGTCSVCSRNRKNNKHNIL